MSTFSATIQWHSMWGKNSALLSNQCGLYKLWSMLRTELERVGIAQPVDPNDKRSSYAHINLQGNLDLKDRLEQAGVITFPLTNLKIKTHSIELQFPAPFDQLHMTLFYQIHYLSTDHQDAIKILTVLQQCLAQVFQCNVSLSDLVACLPNRLKSIQFSRPNENKDQVDVKEQSSIDRPNRRNTQAKRKRTTNQANQSSPLSNNNNNNNAISVNPADLQSMIQSAVALALNTKDKDNDNKDDNNNSQNECVVCMDKTSNCFLQPCGHVKTCFDCANQIQKCPYCQTVITSRSKAFL